MLETRLGKGRYVGTEIYKTLGIEVPMPLPEISKGMLKAIEEMKGAGEEPHMVLDVGISMVHLETALKATAPGTKFYSEDFKKEKYGSERGEAGWIVVPTSDHGVEPGSRNKLYAEQERDKNKKYEIMGARQVVVVALLTHADKGEFLFPVSPYTWARTKDLTASGSRAYLGVFAGSGLLVYDAGNDDYRTDLCGLAVLLRNS